MLGKGLLNNKIQLGLELTKYSNWQLPNLVNLSHVYKFAVPFFDYIIILPFLYNYTPFSIPKQQFIVYLDGGPYIDIDRQFNSS